MNRVSGRNGPGIDANWYLRQLTPNVPFVNPSGCNPLAAAFSLASNTSLRSQLTLPPPFTNQLSAHSTDPVLQWLQTQSPDSALRFCLSSLQQNLMSSGGGASCGREDPAMQNNLNLEKNDKSCRKKPSSRGTWSVFQCKSCSELFISKRSWLKHCFYHCKYHLTCQVCHLTFATRPELSLHVTSMKHSKMFRYSKCTVTQSEYDQLRQKEDSDNDQSQKVDQNSSNQHRSDAEKTNKAQQLDNAMWNAVDEELYDPFIQEDDVDSPRQNCTLQKTSSTQESLMNRDEWGTGVEKRKRDEEKGDGSVPKKLKENGCEKVYPNYNRRNSETALQAPVIDCNLGSTFLGSSVPPCTTMENIGNPANCYPSYTTDISWPSTVPNNVSMGPAWHCNTPEVDRTGALLVSSQQQPYPNASVWSAGMKPEAPTESSWPSQTVPGNNMVHPWPPVLPSNGNMDTIWSSSVPYAQQYQQTQATPSDTTVKWHLSRWQDSTSYEKESSSEDKEYSRICSSSENSADKNQPKSRALDNRKRHDSNGDNQNSYPFKNRALIEITLPDSVTGATNPEKADTNQPGNSGSSHKASIYEYQRQQFSVNNNTDEISRDPRLRVSSQKKTVKSLPNVSKEQSTSKDLHREPKRTAGLEGSAHKDDHENRDRSDVRASKKNASLLPDKDTDANASNPPRENISSTDTRKTLVLSKRRGNLRAMLAQAINMTKPKSPPGSEKVTFREVGTRRSKMSISDCASQKDANRDRSDGDSCKVSSTSQGLMKDTEEVSNNNGTGDSQSKSCLGVSVSNAVFKTEESLECVPQSQNTGSPKQDIINQSRSKISFNIKHKKSFSLARAEFPLTQARKSTDTSSAEGTHCNGYLKEDDLSDKGEILIHKQKLTDKLTVLEKKLAVDKEMEIKQKLPSDCYFPTCESQTSQPQGEDFKYRNATKTKESEMSLSPSRHNQTRNLPLRTWYVGRSPNKVDSPSKKRESGAADSDNDETLTVKEKMLMSLAEVNSLGSLSPYTDEEDDKAQDSKQDDSNQTSYYVFGKHYNNRSRVRNLEMRYQCCLDKLKYIDLFLKDESTSCPSYTSESVVSKEQEDSEVLEVGQEDSKTNLHENECKPNQPCNPQPALPKENRLLSILMREPLKSLPSSSTDKHGSRNTVKHKTQEEDNDYTQKRSFSHNSRKKRHSTQDVKQKRLRCHSCCQIISPVESKKSRRQSFPSRRELNTSSLPLRRPSLSTKDSTHRRKMSPGDNSCYSCSSSTEEINSSREGSPTRCGSSPTFEDCAVTGSLNRSASLRNCSPPDQKASLNDRHPQNSFTKTSSSSLCKYYLTSKYDCPSRNRTSGSVSPRSESPVRQGSPHRSPSRCSLLTGRRSSNQPKLPPRCILPTRHRSPCRHRSLSSCSSTSRHGSPPSRYSWATRQSVASQKSLSCAKKPQHKSPMRKSHRSSHNVFSKHKSLRRYKSNKPRKSCKSPHWTPSNRPSPPRYTLPEHFDISSRFSPLRQTSTSKHSSLHHLRESSISPPRQRTCTYRMTGKGGHSSSSRSTRSEKPITDRSKECHHHHHYQRSTECHSPSQDLKNRFKGKSQTDIKNSSTKSLTKVLKSIQGMRDSNDTSFDAVNLDWPITEGENYLAEIICSDGNRNKSKCRYHSKYAHPDHCNREEDCLSKCKSETETQTANKFTNGLLISSNKKETLKKCSKQTTLGEEDLVSAESPPISSETKKIVDVRHDTHLSSNELKMSTTKDKDFSLLDDRSSSAKQLKEVECVAEEGMPCEGRRSIDIQGEDLELATGKEGYPIIEYEEVSCSNEEYETTNKSTNIDRGDHKDIKSDPRDMLMTVKAMDVKKYICCQVKEEKLMKSMNFGDLERKDALCSVDKTNEHSESLNANMSFSRIEKRNKMLEMNSKKLKKGRRRCHACYEHKTEKSHLGQNAGKFLNTEECYSNPAAYHVAEFDQVSVSTLEIAAADSSTNPTEKSRVTKFYEELFYLADSSEGFEKEGKFFSPETYSREEKKEEKEEALAYKVDALSYDKVDSLGCRKNDSLVWDKENHSSVMRKREKSTGDKANEFLRSQQINESMAIKALDYWAKHENDYSRTKKVDEKVRPRKVGGSTKHGQLGESVEREAEYSPFHDLTERDGTDELMRHKEICDTAQQEKVDDSTEYEEGELVEHEEDEDLYRPEEHDGQTGQEEVGKQRRPRENNDFSGQEEADELKKIEDRLRILGEGDESMEYEEGELIEHEEDEDLHRPEEHNRQTGQEEVGKQRRSIENNDFSGQEEADELKKIEDTLRILGEGDESMEYEEGELVEREEDEELHKPKEYDGLARQEERPRESNELSGQEEVNELKFEDKSRRIDEVDESTEYEEGELVEDEMGEELHQPNEYDGLIEQEEAGKQKRSGENNELSGQEETGELKIEDESRRIDEVDGSTGHEEGELVEEHNELTGLEEAGKQKRSREDNELPRQEEGGELNEIEDKLKSIEEVEESTRSESDELTKEEEFYEPMKFEKLDKSIGHGEIKRSIIATEDGELMAQNEISESLRSLRDYQSLHSPKRNDQPPSLNIDSAGSVDDDRSMEVKGVFAHTVESAIHKNINKSVNDIVNYDTIVYQEEIVPTPLKSGDSIVDEDELIDQDYKDSTDDAADKSVSDNGENSIEYDVEESEDHKAQTSTRQHEELIEHDEESKEVDVDGLVNDKDIALPGHYETDHLNDHGIEDSVEYVEDSEKRIVKDSVDHENDHSIGQQEIGESEDHEVQDAIGHDTEDLTEQEIGKLTDHEVGKLIEVKTDDSVGHEQIRESVDHKVEASVTPKIQEVEEPSGYEVEEPSGYEVEEPSGYEVEEPSGYEVEEPPGYEVEEPSGYEVEEPSGYEVEEPSGYEVEEPSGYEVEEPMPLEEPWDSTGHETDPVGFQDVDEPTRREETEANTRKVDESAGVLEDYQVGRHGDIESTADKVDEATESEVDACMEDDEDGHLLVHEADASAGCKEPNQMTDCEVRESMEHKGVNEMTVHVDDSSAEHGEVALAECKLHAPMEYESVERKDEKSDEQRKTDKLADQDIMEVDELTVHYDGVSVKDEEHNKLKEYDGTSAEVKEVNALEEHEGETPTEHENLVEITCEDGRSKAPEEIDGLTKDFDGLMGHEEMSGLTKEGGLSMEVDGDDDLVESELKTTTDLEEANKLMEHKVDASTEHELSYEHEGDTISGPVEVDNWTEHNDEVLSEHENLNDLMEYEVDTSEGHNAASESTELRGDQYVECEEADRLTKRDLGMPAKFEDVSELARDEPEGLTEHDEDDKSTERQDDTSMVYDEIDRLSDHENDTSTKSRLVDVLAEQENDQPREHTTTDNMVGQEEVVNSRELKTESHETTSPQLESARTSVREDQTNLQKLKGLLDVFKTQTRFNSKRQTKRRRTYKTMEPFDSENIDDLRDISRECEPQQIANLSTNSRDDSSLNVEEKNTLEASLQLERSAGAESKEVKTSFERNSDITSSELCNGYNDVNDNSYDHQSFTYPSDYDSDKSLPCLETLPSVSFMEPSKAGTPRSTRRRSCSNKEEFEEGSEESQNFESREEKPQQASDRVRGRGQQTRRSKGGSRSTSRKSSYTKKKKKDSDSYIPSRNPPSQSSVKTVVQGRYALRSTSRYRRLYGRFSPQTTADPQGDAQNKKEQVCQEASPKPLPQSENGEDKENTGDQKSEDLQDPQSPRDSLSSQDHLGETLENPRQSVVDPPTKTSESLHVVPDIDKVTKEKGIPTVTVCITSRVRNHCPACGTGLTLDSHTSVSLSTGNLRVKCPKCFLAVIMRGVFFQKLCQLKDPPPGPYCKTKILSPSAANPRRKQHIINRVYNHKKGCGVK